MPDQRSASIRRRDATLVPFLVYSGPAPGPERVTSSPKRGQLPCAGATSGRGRSSSSVPPRTTGRARARRPQEPQRSTSLRLPTTCANGRWRPAGLLCTLLCFRGPKARLGRRTTGTTGVAAHGSRPAPGAPWTPCLAPMTCDTASPHCCSRRARQFTTSPASWATRRAPGRRAGRDGYPLRACRCRAVRAAPPPHEAHQAQPLLRPHTALRAARDRSPRASVCSRTCSSTLASSGRDRLRGP